jgi:hypothetical protein
MKSKLRYIESVSMAWIWFLVHIRLPAALLPPTQISYLPQLRDLYTYVTLDNIQVPEFVQEFDRRVCGSSRPVRVPKLSQPRGPI